MTGYLAHQVEHQAFAGLLGLQNPFNMLDVDFNNETSFYDWLSTHLYIHQQIATWTKHPDTDTAKSYSPKFIKNGAAEQKPDEEVMSLIKRKGQTKRYATNRKGKRTIKTSSYS
jgi:vancomycin resistance protein YoaR